MADDEIPPEETRQINELIGLGHLNFALITQMLGARSRAGEGDEVLDIIYRARRFLQNNTKDTSAGPIRLALDMLTTFEQSVRTMAQNPDGWRPQ